MLDVVSCVCVRDWSRRFAERFNSISRVRNVIDSYVEIDKTYLQWTDLRDRKCLTWDDNLSAERM